ncbi:hypothetical protein DLJ58_00075, partial [Micromonospora arida]
ARTPRPAGATDGPIPADQPAPGAGPAAKPAPDAGPAAETVPGVGSVDQTAPGAGLAASDGEPIADPPGRDGRSDHDGGTA